MDIETITTLNELGSQDVIDSRDLVELLANHVGGPPQVLFDAAYLSVQGSDRVEFIRWSAIDRMWYRSPQNPDAGHAADVGERWFSVTECGVLEHCIHDPILSATYRRGFLPVASRS